MMKIGAFAQAGQVPADTIRYYEKIGLLTAGHRNEAGYRVYGEQQLATLRFIRSAKQLGMSLDTIKQLLDIQVNKAEAHCEDVKLFVGQQLKQLEEKIEEFNRMHAAMQQLHDACCGGDEAATCCSILQALEAGDV